MLQWPRLLQDVSRTCMNYRKNCPCKHLTRDCSANVPCHPQIGARLLRPLEHLDVPGRSSYRPSYRDLMTHAASKEIDHFLFAEHSLRAKPVSEHYERSPLGCNSAVGACHAVATAGADNGTWLRPSAGLVPSNSGSPFFLPSCPCCRKSLRQCGFLQWLRLL